MGGVNGWWIVDLEEVSSISVVKLYNRQDCCQFALNNAVVDILNSDMEIVGSQTLSESDPIVVILRFENVSGRYVRVSAGWNEVLMLAEVEVYGIVADELPFIEPLS